MIIIDVDGKRTEFVPPGGRMLTLDEIQNSVGGNYKIECQTNLDGVKHYVIAKATAYTDKLPQNMTASRMCGRMLFGPVAFVKRGIELT